MLVLDPLGDDPSIYDFGSKVVVQADKEGKHPYLYAYAPMRVEQTSDGKDKYISYGQEADPNAVKSFNDLERYVYSIKDVKHFKSAVRLRNMPLKNFIDICGFERVGYDTETMENWYICVLGECRLI